LAYLLTHESAGAARASASVTSFVPSFRVSDRVSLADQSGRRFFTPLAILNCTTVFVAGKSILRIEMAARAVPQSGSRQRLAHATLRAEQTEPTQQIDKGCP
jgi:hypothetical protein